MNTKLSVFICPSTDGFELPGDRLTPIDSYISRFDGHYWPMGIVSIESLAEKMQFCVDHPEWVKKAKHQARSEIIENRDWHKKQRSAD